MARSSTHEAQAEELAYRASDGVEVSLLWSRADDRLRVVVADAKTGDSFELDAAAHDALDVFNHPFAYAAFRSAEREPVYA